MDEGTAIAKGGCSQWCHNLASTSGPGLSPNQGPRCIGEELEVQGAGLGAWLLSPVGSPSWEGWTITPSPMQGERPRWC